MTSSSTLDGCRAINEAITGGSEPRGCSAGSAGLWDSVVVSAPSRALLTPAEMLVIEQIRGSHLRCRIRRNAAA
jgi:hypothetical protein